MAHAATATDPEDDDDDTNQKHHAFSPKALKRVVSTTPCDRQHHLKPLVLAEEIRQCTINKDPQKHPEK
eukprot:5256312-Amphidinium_carterae.1